MLLFCLALFYLVSEISVVSKRIAPRVWCSILLSAKLIHGTMATDNDNTFWYTSSKVWFPQRISISSTNNLKEEEEEQEVLFA